LYSFLNNRNWKVIPAFLLVKYSYHKIMKRIALFLLGLLSALVFTFVLVRHTYQNPDTKMREDKENLD
jgi:hypothetical protein